MNASDSSDAAASLETRKACAIVQGIIAERNPLEIELLLDSDKRRATVADHEAFRLSIATPPHAFDELDEATGESEARQ